MSWMEVKGKQEQQIKLVHDAGEIIKTAANEKRDVTAEENARFEQLHADADKIAAEIRTIQKQADAERALERRIGREDTIERPERDVEFSKRAFDKYLRQGKSRLNDQEWRALAAGGSGDGSDFVPDTFYSTYLSILQDLDDVRASGATVLNSPDGRDLTVPISDDTSNTGEQLAEGVAANDADADPATSNVALPVYKYSSKVVRCSVELVRDSTFDIQGWLAPLLAERIAKITSLKFTTGNGSGTPQGVVAGASSGKVGASTTAITYNEVLDLIKSLKRSYLNGAKFMMNRATLLAVQKLVDGQGNLLFNHGNYQAGMSATIAGYPYIINDNMSDLGAAAKPILFANFGRGYMIRDVQGVELVVFAEKYMNQLQYGYLAWGRHGAVVTDSTAIKYFANASS